MNKGRLNLSRTSEGEVSEEVAEWVHIFAEWPNSEPEAHQRLLTKAGLPDVTIPVQEDGKSTGNLPLRNVLWKYFFLHSSSSFASFLPPSVSGDKSRLKFYQNLLRKRGLEEHIKSIEKDINRSTPSTDFEPLLTDAKLEELRRILIAYSIYDSDLGYCQGLNFIAIMLLVHLEEVDAFWGLLLLLNGFNIRNLFMKNSTMLQDFLHMMEHELMTRFPKLNKHMTEEGITVSMYAMEWITTLFVYNFPLETTRRIWDIMLARGYAGGCGSLAWLYQISMAIFDICRDQFMEWSLDEIMTNIRQLTTEIHPHILLQRAVDFRPTDALKKNLEHLASINRPYQTCCIS